MRFAFQDFEQQKTPGCRREPVVFLQHCFVYIFPLHNRKMPIGKKVTGNSWDYLIFDRNFLNDQFVDTSAIHVNHFNLKIQPVNFLSGYGKASGFIQNQSANCCKVQLG